MNFKEMATSIATTENGAITLGTTGNALLNFMFTAGASRLKEGNELVHNFVEAFKENPEKALKLLFWSRDCRGGLGERKLFRECLKILAVQNPEALIKNIPNIVEMGRWDDLFILLDAEGVSRNVENAVLKYISKHKTDGLLNKWLPRLGGKVSPEKRKIAHKVRKYWRLTVPEYRKHIVSFTNVVETKMCANKFNEIKFETVPSIAHARYTKAFWKRCSEKYSEYLEAVKKGEIKINTSVLTPPEVIRIVKNYGTETTGAEAMWENIPYDVSEHRYLPVCDVSGSMQTNVSGSLTALDISVGMGMFIAERNKGVFQDLVLTFSEKPAFVALKGSLYDRYQALVGAQWSMNTDLVKSFQLILDHAIAHKLPQSEMPEGMVIFSDMEFDDATSRTQTNYQVIQELYKKSGYVMPRIIFWNLNARSNSNYPVSQHESGAALVSGYSPHLMKQFIDGELFNPTSILESIINDPRYSNITI